MAAPTTEEATHLIEFRKRVEDVLKSEEQKTDVYLLRWLRARDLNLEKAESMLRASHIWREENNIDAVLDIRFDSFYAKEYPYSVRGKDKSGQPVVYVCTGKWDLRKVVNKGKIEEFKLYVSYMFETIEKAIRESNVGRSPELFPITQVTVIVDWNGYSYLQLINIKAVQSLLHVGTVYEAHYPEILARCFFINCPSFFNVLLSLIKPILAPKTFSKISCHGHDPSERDKAISETIDVEQIPVILDES